jgi:hypothetical protein
MSMPKITIPEGFSEENALINIVASIALEEAALAHIINAEGEKIQRVVGTFVPEGATDPLPLSGGPADIDGLKSINDSVGDMIDTIESIENSLHTKLTTVLQFIDVPSATGSTGAAANA